MAAVTCRTSGSQFEDNAQIASIPDVNIYLNTWWTEGAVGDVMENGWTRYHSCNIPRGIYLFLKSAMPEPWLGQANHIFTRLQITSNFEGYIIVDDLDFAVKILEPTQDPPPGYLFLCPAKDLQIGPSSYRWPTCPAYWTLDPSGVERLSTEEATQLGFPTTELSTDIEVYSWHTSVYAGLRKFHQSKGFDPCSQDVARHLEYPLFEVSGESEAPIAQCESIFPGDIIELVR
ncbi:hypothetical protein DFH06DRAFT_510941 [Mycena polygramma]|nr:hypothetical protein DFH06DRAFT_510941 [Mycena polygramma]